MSTSDWQDGIGIGRHAVFLDRDGVLNEDLGYIRSISSLKIFDYVPECIQQLQKMGYLAIVISNQSGIARGIIEMDEVEAINSTLKQKTGVNAVYYCPHYDKGVLPKYSVICDCRKPKIGLIEKACQDYEIDLNCSIMVGDRLCDMKLGKNARLRNYLVRSRYEEEWEEASSLADRIVEDLRDVVRDLQFMQTNTKEG